MKFIRQHIDQIIKLCENYNVKTLFAFGSVTTNKFKHDSDIDLLVDIDEKDPIIYSDKYFNLKFDLEDLLKRQIDLIEERAIRNKFLKSEIDRTKVQLYGKGNKNVA